MSGGKTLIGGTAYTIAGGKTLVGGTSYSIAQGKVMKGGTVYTIDMPHENLVPTAVKTDGKTIFNGVGYMDDMYLSYGSGGVYPYHCHTDTTGKCFSTGWIYMPAGTKTLYLKGATWDTSNSMCRMFINHTSYIGTSSLSYDIRATATSGYQSLVYYNATLTTLDTNYYRLDGGSTWTSSVTNVDRWIAFSMVGSGANFQVTFNQPIR